MIRYGHKRPAGHFDHIFTHPMLVKMCGTEPIYRLTFEQLFTNRMEEIKYWGWLESDTGVVSMIYPSFVQFQICFPYGIEVAEKRKEGIRCYLKLLSEELVKC